MPGETPAYPSLRSAPAQQLYQSSSKPPAHPASQDPSSYVAQQRPQQGSYTTRHKQKLRFQPTTPRPHQLSSHHRSGSNRRTIMRTSKSDGGHTWRQIGENPRQQHTLQRQFRAKMRNHRHIPHHQRAPRLPYSVRSVSDGSPIDSNWPQLQRWWPQIPCLLGCQGTIRSLQPPV